MKKVLFILLFIGLLLSCSGMKYPVKYAVTGGTVLDIVYLNNDGESVRGDYTSPWEIELLFNIGDRIGFSVKGQGEELTASITHFDVVDSVTSSEFILFYGRLF